MARSTERIISRSDTLYIYYCGVHGPHTGPKRKKVGRKYGIAIGLLSGVRKECQKINTSTYLPGRLSRNVGRFVLESLKIEPFAVVPLPLDKHRLS